MPDIFLQTISESADWFRKKLHGPTPVRVTWHLIKYCHLRSCRRTCWRRCSCWAIRRAGARCRWPCPPASRGPWRWGCPARPAKGCSVRSSALDGCVHPETWGRWSQGKLLKKHFLKLIKFLWLRVCHRN